jgi:hypothetical protein
MGKKKPMCVSSDIVRAIKPKRTAWVGGKYERQKKGRDWLMCWVLDFAMKSSFIYIHEVHKYY